MNLKISQLPQLHIPDTAILILNIKQFENNLNKIIQCTGKTRDDIISFVTGSVISYADLAEFAAVTGRFPDLKEQQDLNNAIILERGRARFTWR